MYMSLYLHVHVSICSYTTGFLTYYTQCQVVSCFLFCHVESPETYSS